MSTDKKKGPGRKTVMVRRRNPMAKQSTVEISNESDPLVEETLKLANHDLETTRQDTYAFQSDPAPVSSRSERPDGYRPNVAVARPVKESWNSTDKTGFTFDPNAKTKMEPQILAVGGPVAGARRTEMGGLVPYTILGDPEDYDTRCPEEERMAAVQQSGLTSSMLAAHQSDQGSVYSATGSIHSQAKRTTRRGSNKSLAAGRRGSDARTVRSQARTAKTNKSKMTVAMSENSSGELVDHSADERQTRALDLWDKYEQERSVLAEHLLEVRGNSNRPPCMFSGDEFREKVEEYELIEKAMPREEKYRDNLWFMSLRDSWARFIPLGSIFSGLFCVVREKSLSEKAFTVVRNPMQKSVVNTKLQHTIARDGTVHQFHTRDGPETVPKSSWVNMDGIWQKERQLRHNVKELLPFRVDTEGLLVVGSNGVDSELASTAEQEDEDETQSLAAKSVKTSRTKKSKKSKGAEESELAGPCLELEDPNIAFDSNPDNVATQTVCVVNTGTTAVHYTWEKVEQQSKLGLPLRGTNPPGGGFWCCDQKGVLQPGTGFEFPFAFKSHLCGIYTATFKMNTVPAMPESVDPLVVSMRGVVTAPDEHAVKRALLEQHLEHNSVLHCIQDVLMEAIRNVELVPPSAGASEQPPERARIDAKLFAGANTAVLVKRDVPCVRAQTAYYDPEVLEELNQIAESTVACAQMGEPEPDPLGGSAVFEAKLMPRPAVYNASAETEVVEDSWDAAEWSWDYALASLGERQITILDEGERSSELAKLDCAAEKAIWHMHRPNALYPAAVDAVSELAENIEKVACQTRRRMGLQPKDFVAPTDEAEVDTKAAKGKESKGKAAEPEVELDDPELVADFQDALYFKVRGLLCAAVDQFADCAGVVMQEEAERRGEEIE
eukprot:TRINITY_DN2296_c0_g1_i1.p1 TRINITY_DN2296_c0_g1~~TRINITY_DN2296_c0_g1_i1.p1  ORF type:complete len:894 (+),score=225.33 TRINITY_DN2296_c0_g1_i1:149-2830(+)